MLYICCFDFNILNILLLNFVQIDRVDDEEVFVQGFGIFRDFFGADVFFLYIERFLFFEQSKRFGLLKQKSNCYCNIREV